ncbi:nuclear transport factor 2 family protein [Telluria aromaticivorans]|uniref:Nuclear transport factor 2 family protein n=1 Tax=Telluria aromaticivorans TaxID=2725995 RepID=A0A7Y2K1S1_9BURK|nr:nuclear transport factor 2 family protein [Telluria aromaticivorans]NNG24758.1 nuclear transport factor 2 family protein [Telluria aromaticivorans]
MNEQQNIELVRQAYAAYGRGDVEYVLACMAPQVDWEIPAVPGLAFTGKRQGCEQVAEYFKLANEKQAMREFTPKEFIAEGDKVVVLGYGAWTAKDTGLDFESDWVHVFTVKDGRIAAFREFMDAHVAVEAFQCYPLKAGTGAEAGTAPH